MKSLYFLPLLFLFFTMSAQSQTQSYFQEIPSYDEKEFTPGNVVMRMIDGLGYRYYWATEGLTATDLDYRPTDEARSTRETLEHLYGLSETILNAATSTPNIRPATEDWSSFSWQELRQKTLINLEEASGLYKGMTEEELLNCKIIFERNGNQSEYPFWNMINGPIADALTHVGQVVSFRRTSGNPIPSGVNVFLGTNPLSP